jgi:hypothetical protein
MHQKPQSQANRLMGWQLWLYAGHLPCVLVQAGSVLVAVDVSFQSPPAADAFVDTMRCCARQTFACVRICSCARSLTRLSIHWSHRPDSLLSSDARNRWVQSSS